MVFRSSPHLHLPTEEGGSEKGRVSPRGTQGASGGTGIADVTPGYMDFAFCIHEMETLQVHFLLRTFWEASDNLGWACRRSGAGADQHSLASLQCLYLGEVQGMINLFLPYWKEMMNQ